MAWWSKPVGSMWGLVTLGITVIGGALPGVAQTVAAEFALARPARLAQTSPETAPLPERKTVTLFVEGEPQEATFLLYQSDIFITYYPESMEVEESCTDEGCAIIFTNQAVGTAAAFLFPTGATTAAEIEPYFTQLVTENDWQINGDYDDEEFLRYPWMQRIWILQSEDWSVLGSAYFGEDSGRGFGVLSVFPPDAGDGYAPRIGAMLDETQILPRPEE